MGRNRGSFSSVAAAVAGVCVAAAVAARSAQDSALRSKYGPHRLLHEMQFTDYSAVSTVSKSA